MNQFVSPSTTNHTQPFSISQQLALIIFYKPEYSPDLANVYSKSTKLMKSLMFQLKKAIKDILINTETTLWERGFLQGSVLIGRKIDTFVNMIIAEGTTSGFSQHFLAYHCRQKAMSGFKDQDLINFYNKVIALWEQDKKTNKMEYIQLEVQLLEEASQTSMNEIKNQAPQIYSNTQSNYLEGLFKQQKSQFRQKQRTSQMHQESMRPTSFKNSSNASLQFLREFTNDLMMVNINALKRRKYKIITKTIVALDTDEPPLSFQYYDDLERVLFEIFLVAVNYEIKQDGSKSEIV